MIIKAMPNALFKLPFLETMITQVCNLSCQGCTNYSDIKHSGYVSWDNGKKQLEPWLERLVIPDFGIMGGEPLINPEWRQWIRGVRELMPSSQIRFTTNGLLLDRAPDLLDLCREVGNVVLKITVHVKNEVLENHIQSIYQSANWEPVVEHGIHRHRIGQNVRFQVNRPNDFIKTHQGTYSDMRPWNSDPKAAFDRCIQQTCPLLFEGKIYKCSTSGLLKSLLERYHKPNWIEWQPYLAPGLSPTDCDITIDEFVKNFGHPNKICAQCPGGSDGKLNHLSTVSYKSR